MTPGRDPWAFQRWAYETRVGSPARKAVLMVLAVMVDTNTGRCEAKQETLAQACETTARTIRDHLTALAQDGIIARRHQQRRDGSRRGDEFLLLPDWVNEWPDGEPVQRPLKPIQPAVSSPVIHADVSSGRPQPTGRTAQVQPEDPDQSNRKQASGQERPEERPQEHEGVSEARVRAPDRVALDWSDLEHQALDGLGQLVSMRGGELSDAQRAAAVAAARDAGVDPSAVVQKLDRWYGPGGRGETTPITDPVALLVSELGRRATAAPKPPPFTFRKEPSRRARPLAVAAEPERGPVMPPDLQLPDPALRAEWQRVRDQLRAATSESTWEMWLKSLALAGYTTTSLVTELDDPTERPLRTLYIAAPPDTFSWVQTRFVRLINQVVVTSLGEEIPIVVVNSDAQTDTRQAVA